MMESTNLNWIKALILDDSRSILDYVEAVLRQQFLVGAVHKTNTAAHALTLIQEQPDINLVLLDLNMPDIDGIEFLKLLSDQKYKGFLVIMSGVAPRIISTVEELAKRYQLNYVGAILKPIDIVSFQQVMSRLGKSNKKGVGGTRCLKIYEIIRAIKMDQLEVRYQPLVDLHTRKLYGVETLARIHHPSLGVVAPSQFLSKIEHNELMSHLTHIVLEKALTDWLKWQKAGLELKLSVNVSPYNLQQADFVDEVFELLNSKAIPAKCLCLEITESSIATELEQELATITRLNMKGIEFALDDFGQDHASIERLQSLPLSVLKLDKSFFMDEKNKHGQVSLIESCLAIAKRLNMKTVAEGIEGPEQWQLAGELGCDIAQGYFLSKPMKEKELLAWISDWKSKTD